MPLVYVGEEYRRTERPQPAPASRRRINGHIVPWLRRAVPIHNKLTAETL